MKGSKECSEFVVPPSGGMATQFRLKAGRRTKTGHGLRCGLLLAAAVVLPVFAPAQVVVSGTLAAAGGISFIDGYQAAFQQRLRQRKHGYAGVEDFSISRTTDTSLFRLEGRFMQGNEDYRLSVRWEKFDVIYV